jgi:osmotically-inducible protein OsmY
VAAALVLTTALSGFGACTQTLAIPIDDASITARVKTVLLNDTQIGARGIEVQTDAGIVTMSGVVRTADEEQRALTLARQVEGVREVRSSLQVSPGS